MQLNSGELVPANDGDLTMRKLSDAIAIAFFVALAACGSQGDNETTAAPAAKPSASSSKACDILTEVDAARALGRPVEKLAATGGAAGLDICQYGYQGEKLLDMGQVSVTLHANPIAALKQGVVKEGYDAEEMPDIGDEAFWSPQLGLYVGKGGRTALFMIGSHDIKDSKAPAIALARATVDRM